MEKVKINYLQLLFLYAYLRQIDLSLDRGRWNLWIELQDYFKKDNIKVNNVIQYIVNVFSLPKIDMETFVFFQKNKTIVEHFKSLIPNNLQLNKDELLYCCKLLLNFEKKIISSREYSIDVEQARIDIANFYTNVLGKMISTKDLNILMKIEHFNQNDKIIDYVKLNQFIPNDFTEYSKNYKS